MTKQHSTTVTLLAIAIQAGIAVFGCVVAGIFSRAIWELWMLGFTLFYTV